MAKKTAKKSAKKAAKKSPKKAARKSAKKTAKRGPKDREYVNKKQKYEVSYESTRKTPAKKFGGGRKTAGRKTARRSAR
jgi:hypothetical protein